MSDYNDVTSIEGLGNFFETIWHDTEGYVYLPTLDRKNSNTWRKSMFKWPEHKSHVVNHVLGNTAKGLDVYYAPVIFDNSKEPKPIKENVLGSWVCWAEYDGLAPKEWTSETVVTSDGTEKRTPVPPPTIRVASSGNGKEHVYWELDKFSEDIKWIENTNRSITYSTRADTSGWDINQVLRPPYTNNYKYPSEPPVTIIFASQIKYANDRFQDLKPVQQLVSDSINTDNLPNVEAIVAKYPWDSDHFKFFMDSSIMEGERSAALMRLGYICAEMGMTDTEVYATLVNADDRWKKYVGRSDRKVRLLDILNRARTKHPTALANLTFGALSGIVEVETDTQYIYGTKEFLDSTIEVEWALEDFLEVGGIGMIASSPGVGKTQMSLQLAIACALGKDFLGWKIKKNMRITFISCEMSHVALKKFMALIVSHYVNEVDDVDTLMTQLDENLKIIPLGESLPIDREVTRTWLNTLLEQTKPEGIIIDSLAKLCMSSLDEETAKVIFHHLSLLRKKFGCFIWLIHHNRKSNENNKVPTSLDDIYGSVYVTTDVTSVLLLYKKSSEPKNLIHVLNVKSRLSEERDAFTVERNSQLYFTVTHETINSDVSPVGAGLLKGEANGDANLELG